MRYPPEVQDKIDVLNQYEWDENLESFNIIHLYPLDIAFPDGYYDARKFRLIAFNIKTMTKKDFDIHDAVFYHDNILIDRSTIFADGSTLIKFKEMATVIYNGQAIEIGRYKK